MALVRVPGIVVPARFVANRACRNSSSGHGPASRLLADKAINNYSRMISFGDFQKVDVRVGRILRAEAFPEARKPAYKLVIDFGGEIGERKSSAQLTDRYRREDLVGRLVVAVVNFPPRQIGPYLSEVLTLGVPDERGAVVLLAPDGEVPIGGRMF